MTSAIIAPMPQQVKDSFFTVKVLFSPVLWIKQKFLFFDKRLDGAISFFFKHFGKSRFMISMSKKIQILGIEKLFLKGPKAFVYFFLFYLIRDTILYILLPIYFASIVD